MTVRQASLSGWAVNPSTIQILVELAEYSAQVYCWCRPAANVPRTCPKPRATIGWYMMSLASQLKIYGLERSKSQRVVPTESSPVFVPSVFVPGTVLVVIATILPGLAEDDEGDISQLFLLSRR